MDVEELDKALESASYIAEIVHKNEMLRCELAVSENRVKYLLERNKKLRANIEQLENEIDDKDATIVNIVKLRCCATCGFLERDGLQYPVCMLNNSENEMNDESYSCDNWFFRELKQV